VGINLQINNGPTWILFLSFSYKRRWRKRSDAWAWRPWRPIWWWSSRNRFLLLSALIIKKKKERTVGPKKRKGKTDQLVLSFISFIYVRTGNRWPVKGKLEAWRSADRRFQALTLLFPRPSIDPPHKRKRETFILKMKSIVSFSFFFVCRILSF